MNRLIEWIKQHQVAVFFLLAFAITWGAVIPAMAMNSETGLSSRCSCSI